MASDPSKGGDEARPASPPPGAPWDVGLAAQLDVWEPGRADAEHSLTDLVNRVLDKGVVITGEVTISVAGVDLVYLGLSAVLTSVSTARALRRPSDGASNGDAGR